MRDVRLNEMGFIFQQMYMLRNLSVFDNIILPSCQSHKIKESRKETTKRGESLMRRLGIVDVAAMTLPKCPVDSCNAPASAGV